MSHNQDSSAQEMSRKIAALEKQIADSQQEKEKILKALKSERQMRKQAEASKKASDKEKDQVILALQQSLCEAQKEVQTVKEHWSAEFDRVSEFWRQENQRLTETWKKEAEDSVFWRLTQDIRWSAQRKKIQDIQADFRQVSQVVLEKDHLIGQITAEKKSLESRVLECEANLKAKDMEIIQSGTEWTVKLTALEDLMKNELATQEENFNREGLHNRVSQMEDTIVQLKKDNANLQERHLSLQELQKDGSRKEEECRMKLATMESEIQVLTKENSHLQELASKTDKEKAKMRKEQEKARKEEEKRLKKEKAEEEERQKKQQKEDERRQKGELQRQKKEKAEREKREKKEREEREKQERKERRKK